MLILFLVSSTSALSCLPYQCAPVDYKMPENYCANSYNSTFFLKPCPSGYTCNLTSGQCTQTPPTVKTLSYPGEPCVINSDCYLSNCSSKICMGYNINDNCTAHEDCNPGLRCASGICSKQLDLTNSGCFDDYDCINSAGCNLTAGSSMGTCIAYLSVTIGLPVSDCSGGVSYLCKTSECLKTAKFGTYGVCKLSTSSVNAIPTACSLNSQCIGSDGQYHYTSSCQCGYNNNGAAYCSVFNGDLPGQVYYNTWQSALVANAGVCNTVRRFSNACLMLVKYYEKVLIATWGFYYYPEMQFNDQCVREMITYDGYEESDFSSYLAGMAVAVLGFF